MVLSSTLNMYKNMLKMARSFPPSQRLDSIQRIREGFRLNISETDPQKMQELLKHAQSTLGYLKIVTPRQAGARSQEGVTRIVFGESKEQPGRAVSNWTGKNMDPDSVKRHYQSLKRAGFKDNSHAKGGAF